MIKPQAPIGGFLFLIKRNLQKRFFLFLISTCFLQFANGQNCINPINLQNDTLEICPYESISFCVNDSIHCLKWLPEDLFPLPSSTVQGNTETLEIFNDTIIQFIKTDSDGNLIEEIPIVIDVEDFSIDLDEYLEICGFNDSILIEPIIIGGSDNLSFEWSNGDTTQNIIVYPDSTTYYNLTAVDDSTGCTAIAGITIGFKEIPEIFIEASAPSICPSEEPAFQSEQPSRSILTDPYCGVSAITLNVPLDGDYLFEWSSDSLATDSFIVVYQPGIYSVTVTSIEEPFCPVEASYEVIACSEVNINSSIQLSNGNIEHHLEVDASNGSSFVWNTGSTTDTIIVTQPGSYSVTVTSPEGCFFTESFNINLPCRMPEDGYVYTPGETGIYIGKDTLLDFRDTVSYPKGALDQVMFGEKLYLKTENVAWNNGFGGYVNSSGQLYNSSQNNFEIDISSIYLGEVIPVAESCECRLYKRFESYLWYKATRDGTTLVEDALNITFPLTNPNTFHLVTQEVDRVFCIKPNQNNEFNNDNLVDAILSKGVTNSINDHALLDGLFQEIPAYLEQDVNTSNDDYNGCYYLYEDDTNHLIVISDTGIDTIVDDQLVKNRLEDLSAGNFPPNKDFISFFERSGNALTFDILINEEGLQIAAGEWLGDPRKSTFKKQIQRIVKTKFKNADSAEDSAFPTGNFQGEGLDGKLDAQDLSILKWISFGFGELKHVVNNGEINPAIWKPDNEQYNSKPLHIWIPIAAVGDQTLAEYKDIKELVEMVGKIIDDPINTVSSVYEGFKNIKVEEIPNQIFTAVQAQYDSLFAETYNGQYQRGRALTEVTFEITKAGLSGGGIIILLTIHESFNEFIRKIFGINTKNKLKNSKKDGIQFKEDFKDLTPEQKQKFIDNPKMVDLWDKLGDHEVAKNIELLEKAATDFPDKLDDIANYYATLKAPKGKKLKVNYEHTIAFNANNIKTINYDKHGFPDFTPHSRAEWNYQPDPNGPNRLDNINDSGRANTWFKEKFEMQGLVAGKDFEISSNGQIKIEIEVTNAAGETKLQLVPHTWHHHQDGRSMFPVPTYIHNAINSSNPVQGFPHSGGRKIIDKGLEGLFNGPQF